MLNSSELLLGSRRETAQPAPSERKPSRAPPSCPKATALRPCRVSPGGLGDPRDRGASGNAECGHLISWRPAGQNQERASAGAVREQLCVPKTVYVFRRLSYRRSSIVSSRSVHRRLAASLPFASSSVHAPRYIWQSSCFDSNRRWCLGRAAHVFTSVARILPSHRVGVEVLETSTLFAARI
jgi:hypothetical protein